MQESDRPDPDKLLKAVADDPHAQRKGRLRVFFGMSAGVGKTYAMLQAANERRREGLDVIVGLVETHGRKETAALLENLEILPRANLEYKGTLLKEMDLDAILRRAPQLVLVDELAHTNAPGSRHPKRYQDVLELLDAGIDVYTTINIQHLESRKDLVEEIAQIKIRESVPDSILERAQQIELVDIAPSELLKRLKEGKVYLGDRAETAARNFFKPDTLTALREMALRMTAEKVDHELQQYVGAKTDVTPWKTRERLLVAVSHSPYSERLIRATRRLAYSQEAPWIAVYVENDAALTSMDKIQLEKNLRLARELGAEVLTTRDTDIVEALKRTAKQKNVTQIVVGRPTRRWLEDLLKGGTLLDRLVRENWGIDVHVIRQPKTTDSVHHGLFRLQFKTGWIAYWNVLWFFLGLGMLAGVLAPGIGYRSVGFLFLLGVVLVGLAGSMGPVVFAALLSAFCWNFFFIPPRLTFAISAPEDFIMIATYFVIAVTTGLLTERIRRHERVIREREERTNVLYEVLREISASRGKDEFLEKVIRRMGPIFGGDCGVLLKDPAGKLSRDYKPYAPAEVSDKEFAVAEWSFASGQHAGWSTDTLSEARSLHVPLKGASETVGVFVFRPQTKEPLSFEQQNLLYSVCRQLAMSLERHFIENRLRDNARLKESEKLHQTLLSSISHEMRTPLTAIMGAASGLEEGAAVSPETRKVLVQEVLRAGERLNRVIENLLDMSRLNSGVLQLKKEWHDVHDLIGVVLQRLQRPLEERKVSVSLPEDLPLVEIDYRLMEHAISNLVLNAATHTPPGAEICIRANADGDSVRIIVEDSGAGIPKESLPLLFDKFYRVPGTPAGGTGLGLSIVKSIVESHRGRVRAENREDGGARFVIAVPRGLAPEMPKDLGQ